jgi:ElaB/YqjD/DUF883 family membrane-anchored ribosome-binding protein
VDRELEVIRDEMEMTRANLADKLGALENQVRETVTSATETVSSTVEGVKEVVGTVSETVDSVTETLNFPRQIEQHPWIALGIAVAAGCAAGYLLSGSSHHEPRYQPPRYEPPRPQPMPDLHFQQITPSPTPTPSSATFPTPPAPAKEEKKDEKPSLAAQAASMLPGLESLMPDLKDISSTVVSGLGGLAVGSLMSFIRELASQNLPEQWKGEVGNLVDQVTRQLGGKVQPVREEPKPAEPQQQQNEPRPNEPKPQQSSPNENRGPRNPRSQPAYTG